MRILIYGINYAPELTGIGKYSGEMATWLAARGHDVRMVTAPPYYPAWKVVAPYSAKAYTRENLKGVQVWRCPLWVPSRLSGVKRLIHLGSFALSSMPVMLRQIFWRPQVVWVVEPAFFCTPAALITARATGARAWLHIQDFEIDAAFDLGILKGRLLRRIVLGVEGWITRQFDVVSTISQRMLEKAKGKSVPQSRFNFFPNWVDLSTFNPTVEGVENYRRELGIQADEVVALYSGNMGGKQGLEILAEAARACPDIRFIFCGDGGGRQDLMARCSGLQNVQFLGLQEVNRLPDFLSMADIHLLPQRADAADLVMPSKLTGMLASARPVVATAHPETELATVVKTCGLVVPPENASALAEALMLLKLDRDLRIRLGKVGLSYAMEHMDKESVLLRFERDLAAH